MKKYLDQLLSDIEEIIVTRWREHPPHLWCAGAKDRGIELPKAITPAEAVRIKKKHLEMVESVPPEEIFGEMEIRVTRKESLKLKSMYSIFQIAPEAFPSPDLLSEEEVEKVANSIVRLWAAFNFTAAYSRKAKGRDIYPLLLKRMHGEEKAPQYCVYGIEFCHYIPEDCPFKRPEACDCIDMKADFEAREKQAKE